MDDPTPEVATAELSRRFRPKPISIAVAIVSLLLFVGGALVSGAPGAGGYHVGHVVGAFVGTALLALLLGWLGFRLAGRSNAVGNACLCAVLLLGAACFGVRAWQRVHERRTLEGITLSAAEASKSLRARIAQDGVLEPGDAYFDATISALNDAAAQLSGDPQRVARAAARVTESMRAARQAYAQAYNGFMQAGGLKPSSLRSADDVLERIESARALQRAGEALTQVVTNLPDEFRAGLVAAELSMEETDSAVAVFRQSSRLDLLREIRQTDRELCAGMLELLELLRAHAGKWAYDPKVDRLVFKDATALAAYKQAVTRLSTIADEQARLRTKYVSP